MALEVDILNVDESGNTLDISVSVSTSTTDTIDYTLNINETGTDGQVDRTGTLYGGAGSYPGDANIEDVSFGIGDTTGGTVTAVITAPDEYVGPEYQDQVNWGGGGSGPVGDPTVEVSNCDPQPTSSGDLDVSYTLAPTDRSGRDVGITIKVDGQRVGFQNHYVPGRGGSFSQTIAADRLPTGTDMPVEIGVDGDFSECGTVTVESDDPADEPAGGGSGGSDSPVNVALSCDGLPDEVSPNEMVQIGYDVENNGSERADVTVQLLRNGDLMNTRDVSVFPATTRTGNFYAQVGGEPGDYTFEIQTA